MKWAIIKDNKTDIFSQIDHKTNNYDNLYDEIELKGVEVKF